MAELLAMVEGEISEFDSGEDRAAAVPLFILEAIDRVFKLVTALAAFPSEPAYSQALNRAGAVLQRAMAFLEDEFRLLLEETGSVPAESTKWAAPPPQSSTYDADRSPRTPLQEPTSNSAATAGGGGGQDSPAYLPETVEMLRRIASTMVFAVLRRNVFELGISSLGFEKMSIEEVQKMPWESLEGEIAAWIRAFRHVASVSFPRERDLCCAVFAGRPRIAGGLFGNLFRGVVIQFLDFAEAVAMTKRSAEKLFKLLDMFEALRELTEKMEGIYYQEEEEDEGDDPAPAADLKAEIAAARSRLGEAAVGIFSELENSIKSDAGRTPVPGGAVHPSPATSRNPNPNSTGGNRHSPFAMQLMAVMDLLDANLEAKSKLYKDPSLSHIFLMNNGRYIVQKIKGTAEIHGLLGDAWCRKRSSYLRQYHKNYQRETWGKVLGCFRDEGLQVKGSVSKPVLKERFRSFNAMFEEIHKTQSCWIVSDEQLQSELRVSVCSVVSEKYIKFGPEELETFIDDLFDGTPASTVKRRS
ncbi:unnamed protein product [Spirodela intermedia]|uniref:Exocyst subunit Exo70 family protein n=1 Tax=Spirodela intermedia TaxID=51605 RepID=A0ABN7EC80_SPIIN|nr:unnamed protein product [Spirodela intermedia]